jgi:hypothetical protein
MKQFFLRNILVILGIVLGAAGGYLYYYFVGCSSGSCSITSSPTNSILYGSLMGYLLLTMFEKQKPAVK